MFVVYLVLPDNKHAPAHFSNLGLSESIAISSSRQLGLPIGSVGKGPSRVRAIHAPVLVPEAPLNKRGSPISWQEHIETAW